MKLLALDLGTKTGWALYDDGHVVSGVEAFRNSRFSGGGMRYLRFNRWLTELNCSSGEIDEIYYEEVRAHRGVDAAHTYGGFLATLQSWCEHRSIPYDAIPVGVIKRYVTGRGNASKAEVKEAVSALGWVPPIDDNHADALALLRYVLSERTIDGDAAVKEVLAR